MTATEPSAIDPPDCCQREPLLSSVPRSCVKVPHSLENVDRDVVVRTFEYDDGSTIAVDFGTSAADISVDVVGSTAIIVTDGEQFEFELPPEATAVSARNGVLTIDE
ncbi:hypothetical protein HTG_09740 [Natrinema mahii]|nr:hypothetical protein HTG_09740 [Natrinema mahii]